MRTRGGIRRGFTRLSDRVGGSSKLPVVVRYTGQLYATSSFTFTAVTDGPHTFSAWGPGAACNSAVTIGGNSGASSRKTVDLATGDQVSISIGFTTGTASAGAPTTVTRTGIIALSCQPAQGQGTGVAAATATGGDLNTAGNRATNAFGADAPSDGYYPGGTGGRNSTTGPQWPGAGGWADGSINFVGAPGGVLVTYAKEGPL